MGTLGKRIFSMLRIGFVCVFSALFMPVFAAYGCESDEIDVDGDCKSSVFSVTTSNIAVNGKFEFKISAKGTFYVNCGDGGTLKSGSSVLSYNTISHNNTNFATYTCSYSTSGVKTIYFAAGDVQEYYANDGAARGAIVFYTNTTNAALITAVNGSLGAVFPTLGSAANQIPTFAQTFSHCTNLHTIPADLFSTCDGNGENCTGATGTTRFMFQQTFEYSGLTSIPSGLFDNNSVTTESDVKNKNFGFMFNATFQNCESLEPTIDNNNEPIPGDLFKNIKYTAGSLFKATFKQCTKLKTIPSELFEHIKSNPEPDNTDTVHQDHAFNMVFDGCTGLIALPERLFKNITRYGIYEFFCTFRNCTGLTGTIPASMFAGLIVKGSPGSATSTNFMKDIFANDTSLSDTCPNGDEVPTAYKNNYWNSKPACGSISVTVDYSCGDGEYTAPGTQTVELNSDVIAKDYNDDNATCKSGQRIMLGWIVNGDTNNVIQPGDNFTVTEETTLTAKYVDAEFWVDTVSLNAGAEVKFSMTANGNFWVDCGDGGTLKNENGTDLGNRIERTDTNLGVYKCVYNSGGVKTISWAHDDTIRGYAAYTDQILDNLLMIAPIGFYFGDDTVNEYIAKANGELNKLFPKISTGGNGRIPLFTSMFRGCVNLNTIGKDLFKDINDPFTYRFAHTFRGCTSLTSVPDGLFKYINGGAHSLFKSTFLGCIGLETLPPDLFDGISSISINHGNLFYGTFAGCTGLKYIPAELFQNISGASGNMFAYTFQNCTALKYIPQNLFQSVSLTSSNAGKGMFQGTFKGCSGLGEDYLNPDKQNSPYYNIVPIPNGLFNGTSQSATSLFSETFYGCSALKHIPEDLFQKVSGAADSMFSETFNGSGLRYIPSGLFDGVSGAASNMFYKTFFNCSHLGEDYENEDSPYHNIDPIPNELFDGVSGAAGNMFDETFAGCSKLPYIPADLFQNVTGSASVMFWKTFNGCSSIKFIPSGLFRNISGAASRMFESTFSSCTGLGTDTSPDAPDTIPDDLFDGVSGSASRLFYETFAYCSNLTTIPAGLFKNVSGAADSMFYGTFWADGKLRYITETTQSDPTSDSTTTTTRYMPKSMWEQFLTDNRGVTDGHLYGVDVTPSMTNYMFTNTALATQCPDGTYQYETGYESYWGNRVVCIPCPDAYQYSEQGAASVTQCYTEREQSCQQNECSVPDGCSGVNCKECDCNNIGTYLVYADSDGTGDGTTVGDTSSVSCDQTVANGIAPDNYYYNETLEICLPEIYTITYDCGNGDGIAPESHTIYIYDGFNPKPYSGCYKNDVNDKPQMFTGWRVRINGVDTDDVVFPGDALAWNYTNDITLVAQWADTEFSMTTVDTNEIDISIPASGTFYVDWGDGYANLLTSEEAQCEVWSSSTFHGYSEPGSYTVKISGDATGYCTDENLGLFNNAFGVSQNSIKSLYGSLGAVFPILGENMGDYPIFEYVFSWQESLTTLPDTLFSDYHVARPSMFSFMFEGSGLTELPHRLFATIDGSATNMFGSTFSNCESLTTIYSDLFTYVDENNVVHGIQGGAGNMFVGTFANSGLTEIPDGLFIGINQPATDMFTSTFYHSKIQSVPQNLFSHINGAADNMFGWTFGECEDLVSVPSNLFSQCDNNGVCTGVNNAASTMFTNTFANSGLSSIGGNNYIPKSMFAGLFQNNEPDTPDQDFMTDIFTDTRLATQCPYGTLPVDTVYNEYFTPKVMCEPGYVVTYSCGDDADGGTAPDGQVIKPNEELLPSPYGTCYKNDVNDKPQMFTGWRVRINGVDTDDVLFPGQAIDWNYTDNVTLVAQWADTEFSMTTITLPVLEDTYFSISAGGTFYVDWGDGYAETRTSGAQCDDEQSAMWTHAYDTQDSYTIKISGEATEYCDINTVPAFKAGGMNEESQYIASLYGSLGALFPMLGEGPGNIPYFYNSFGGTTNLTTVPGTLFDGINVAIDDMFWETFSGSGISSLPPRLFAGISNTANYLFDATFKNCENLTTLPSDLFSYVDENNVVHGIQGGADYMFVDTFTNSGLTEIPDGLFIGINQPAEYMFVSTFNTCQQLTTIRGNDPFRNIHGAADGMFFATFRECNSLSSVPDDLFSGIYVNETNAQDGEQLFSSTFAYCSALPEIKSQWFSGITAPALEMFGGTFTGCSSLRSIPDGLFSNVVINETNKYNAERMFNNTFSGCDGLLELPQNMFTNVTDLIDNDGIFVETFSYCDNLGSDSTKRQYIPYSMMSGLFENGSPAPSSVSDMFEGTKLATQCPTGTDKFDTPYEDYWGYNSENGEHPVVCRDAVTIDYRCGEDEPIINALHDSVNLGASYTPAAANGYCARNGYAFNGWAVSGTDDVVTAGEPVNPWYDSNKVLTAQWTDCGTSSWCDENGKHACPAGTHTIGFGAGADEENDCGHIMHIGDKKLYLRKNKKSDHALVVKYNGVPYYGNVSTDNVKMSHGTDKRLHIQGEDGIIYSIYDDSGYEYTQSQQ